jgi:hypothetical protein
MRCRGGKRQNMSRRSEEKRKKEIESQRDGEG